MPDYQQEDISLEQQIKFLENELKLREHVYQEAIANFAKTSQNFEQEYNSIQSVTIFNQWVKNGLLKYKMDEG